MPSVVGIVEQLLRASDPRIVDQHINPRLFTQHELKIQRLVNRLQGMIEELKKQNANLKNILLDKDRFIGRYYLDGPNEDEI